MSIKHRTGSTYLEIGKKINNLQVEDLISHILFKKQLDKEIATFLYKSRNIGKTRDQICKEVNFARSSVFDSLNRMILMDLIEQDHKIINKIKKGRPSTLFYLKYVKQGNKR